MWKYRLSEFREISGWIHMKKTLGYLRQIAFLIMQVFNYEQILSYPKDICKRHIGVRVYLVINIPYIVRFIKSHILILISYLYF